MRLHGKWIRVQSIRPPATTVGGLDVPQTARKRSDIVRVLAVSPEVPIEIGDVLVALPFSGVTCFAGNTEYRFIESDDVVARLDKEDMDDGGCNDSGDPDNDLDQGD